MIRSWVRIPIITFFLLPKFIIGQSAYKVTVAQMQKAYAQAIFEHLKATEGQATFTFDTLFVGKHEEFPDIKLPAVIRSKKIVFLTPEESVERNKRAKPFVLVNVIEDGFTYAQAGFLFVTFHSLHPQHNAYVKLKYDAAKKEYKLEKPIRFDYSYKK